MATLFNNKFILLFLFILIACGGEIKSQSREDLTNLKVEELTDEQLRRFIFIADRNGISEQQIEEQMLQRGVNPVEIVKFKNRMQSIRKTLSSNTAFSNKNLSERNMSDSLSVQRGGQWSYNDLFKELKPLKFGFDIFNNPMLSFEPDLKIPTPINYQVGPGDELVINVFGYSDAVYKLVVSPEGTIRIPLCGIITVGGLSMEQARNVIRSKLSSTIYKAIRSGQTKVDVSLGSIRSIKVTVIGEAAMPGTFTLPSLATAFNALYACGGPSENGTLRNIQVIRNNKAIATIDVYEFLVNGTKKNDIRLMDQDVIKIHTYETRIELKGEVKKPGVYDVIKNETLDKIIGYAGGFTDIAYKARVQVFQNTLKERRISSLEEAQIFKLIPQPGDTYIIGKLLNRFTNRISIRGAVYRPGDYELKGQTTLRMLINDAEGLREDAFMNRGLIHRLKDDLSPEIISFDPGKIINGTETDIQLKPEDRITIFSKFDLQEGLYVLIDGEVAGPGYFLYEEGMTVEDVILMAGGLKESSYMKRVEISRRVKDSAITNGVPSAKALIYQHNIDASFRDSSLAQRFILQPFDEITIRTLPGYTPQRNVIVEGEVMYTGRYTLETNTARISDLLKRAGGLTPDAYIPGASLVRARSTSGNEQANFQRGLKKLVRENFKSGESGALIQSEYNAALQERSQAIGIRLQNILDDPGSEYDLLLNEGDTLRIPKLLQTVHVNGEVLYPALIRHEKGMRFKTYINKAGGFNDRSSKKRSYVVHANGSIAGTKSFLFFRSYPTINPGDEIYIPVKRERERLNTAQVITIGSTLISMMAIVITLLR
jgi:protein involved in polysaccharide export with SLBB domain